MAVGKLAGLELRQPVDTMSRYRSLEVADLLPNCLYTIVHAHRAVLGSTAA